MCVFQYREWNFAKSKYQTAWCQVKEKSPRAVGATELPFGEQVARETGEIDDVRCREKGRVLQRQLMQYFNTYRWKRRQTEGPELDLPAFIDSRIEQRRGGRPSEKIFLNRVRTDLAFGLTILCDSSLSTDSWVNGHHTYHVIREAAAILSFALDGVDVPWSLAAFNSFTRHECHYRLLKDFQDHPRVLRGNLAMIKPDGYTRIGPALRHAASRLEALRARRNMLIVVTDAKPTDYDYYDGRYGAEDVRRAVLELKAKRIETYGLSISDTTKEQSVRMFGHATASCTTPEQLSRLLFQFFVKFISKKNH